MTVHLDLPWTAATLEQRVGRIARFGSRHREVFVYAIDPPAPSQQLVRAEAIIRRKAGLTEANIGASRIPPLFSRSEEAPRSEVEDAEAVRRELTKWIEGDKSAAGSGTICAAAAAQRDGVLALVTVRGKATLIAGCDTRMSADFRTVRETLDLAPGDAVQVSPRRIDAATHSVRQWLESELAAEDAGRSESGQTVLTRRLTARLARHLSTWPRHHQPHYSARIAAVHRRIQSPLTLGIESEIHELLRVDLGAPEFLTALEQIVGTACADAQDPASGMRAVLILERC